MSRDIIFPNDAVHNVNVNVRDFVPGKPGKSPYIGDDGWWYYYDEETDSWVKSDAYAMAATEAKTAAEAAQTAAETAQGKAETAQGKAEDAQTAAETAQGKAEDAQTAAETAQGKAEDAQTAAETAQDKAEDAQEAAEDAADRAEAAVETISGTIKFERFLTSTDNLFALPVGVYGIQTSPKPSNMPTGFPSTEVGYITVFSVNNGTTVFALLIACWSKRMWLRTGYDWVEITNTGMVTTAINSAISGMIKFQRYLSSSDDLFALPVGVYGIQSESNNKPSNMPNGFILTDVGFIVVLESESNVTKFAFVIDSYGRKIWVRTGYEWLEIATTSVVEAIANNLLTTFSKAQSDELLHISSDFYASDTEIASTKTQYKYLDYSGVKDISSSYPDWYVTNEIDVNPLTFYYITASARSTDHYLYAIYDSNGTVLAYESSPTWDIVSLTKKMIYTPYGASKIRIASISGSSGAALYSAQEKSINKKWFGLKWACIGDSLTAVNDTASEKYHTLIANKTGINVVNLGAGGTGYKKSFNNVDGFVDRTDEIPLDSDVVTIFGSGNDASYTIGTPSDTTTDTLCGCINLTIERIFTRIPTCKLGIITPTPWQAYDPSDTTNWMYQYSAAIVQICKNWGVPCLDLYHCSNLRPWDSDFRSIAYSNADGTHPNNAGHAIFAPRIQGFLDTLLLH